MIEFTHDGPFADKADQLFPDRVRVIGLGQTGAAACDQIVLHGRPAQDLWVFDSDQQVIEGSVVPNRHLLGQTLVHGLGCSGDLPLAREIVAMEEGLIAPVVRGCDFLILILGLSGATGVAMAERLIELGKEAGAKVIVVGVQPFAFEGWARRERAIQAIGSMRREADSVLILSHDRLAEDPATRKNVRHGFHLMHELLAKTAQALAQVVCKRGLIQLSFADVRSLYGRYAGSEVLENCWVSHVEGTSRDCCEELIAELLEGPLLADEMIWKQIDHAIVAVSGTRDLGLLDVQELVGALKERLPVNIPIATSASLDEENHNKVRVSVLLATTAPVPGLAVEQVPLPIKHFSDTQVLPDLKATTKIDVSVLPVVAGSPLKAKPLRPLITPATPPRPVAVPVPVPMAEIPVPVVAPVEEPLAVEEAPDVFGDELQTEVDEVEAELEAMDAEMPEPEPALASGPAPLAPTRVTKSKARQAEMQFESPVRGRFEKTHETMYRGENLDQPTFRRRGLVIRT